jgi:uncharacterized Zn-finger protein
MEGHDDLVRIDLSFPLDDDGFLRRECPGCGREFKWLPTVDHSDLESVDQDQSDAGTYHCPYCATAAAADDWLTRGQARILEQAVMDRVVTPGVRSLEESLQGLEQSSGGLIKASLNRPTQRSSRLTEANDMLRVEFRCHPGEPIKVLETWIGPLYCLVCGRSQGNA